MTATASPTGLDGVQRTQLERLVTRARVALEADLGAQAEGRFGIHVDGTIEDEQALPDDASNRATRRDLVEIIDHLRSLGETVPGAVTRLVREATFTHLNRLLATRIAEAIGLLPESLAAGRESRGFRDLVEIMPVLSEDYWGYLRLCGDELAVDAPALFDPRNPLLALAPSTAALDDVIALLADQGASDLWLATDTLGWTYQFFNSREERRAMREEASAPRDSRELAVRNQFFTPRYVVDFLVQNTLGRRLIENDPMSPLLQELPMLADPPTEHGSSLDLRDLAVLDPACGSGHFLLGCYDLLELAWGLRGVAPSDCAPTIVASLWGVDIDARCAQVASAALVLRARRHCRDLPLPRPNIVTARALPDGAKEWDEVLGSISPRGRALVHRMRDVLKQAPVLGPLLKVEERLAAEIRREFTGSDVERGTLAEEISADELRGIEAEVLRALEQFADSASSTPAERLLAAESTDAIRFVGAMQRSYDVVLMNPPFGDGVPAARTYIASAYPAEKDDLAGCMVRRAFDLLSEGGLIGALINRTLLFRSAFETFRTDCLLGGTHGSVTCAADLGWGVLEGAAVEAAAVVLERPVKSRPQHGRYVVVRCLEDVDKETGLRRALGDVEHRKRFSGTVDRLAQLPNKPFCYWLPASISDQLASMPSLTAQGITAYTGLITGDNDRFLRLRWEVEACDLGRTWMPIAKGGEYRPYWDDIHLVVDWRDDGRALLDHQSSMARNRDKYGAPGLTYPYRTTSDLSLRVLPYGVVFSDGGPGVFAGDLEDALALLPLSYTRLFKYLLELTVGLGDASVSGSAARNYLTGQLNALKVPKPQGESRQALAAVARRGIARQRRRDACDETAAYFVSVVPLEGSIRRLDDLVVEELRRLVSDTNEAFEDANVAERELADLFGLEDPAFLDEEWGAFLGSFPKEPLSTEEQEQLGDHKIDEQSIVQWALQTRGAGRGTTKKAFVWDRRVELLAVIFRRHPAVAAQAFCDVPAFRDETRRRIAEDLVSYLVGIAFGRWDVRNSGISSRAFAHDPFAAPPVIATTVVAGGGQGASLTAGGLESPQTFMLIDEPGHERDVASVVSSVALQMSEHSEELISESIRIMNQPSLRHYLRRRFFKDHLRRYSKSRRRAPLYWPLTVPSGRWGVWVFAPMLTRETLYGLAAEASRRERLAAEATARLRREQQEGGVGRSTRKVAEELDAEEQLAEELRRFQAEAERIAGLGWEPNLDDGIVLCAAPLADLFPAWPDAKKARDELRKGHYEWATVARWAGEL